MWIASVTCIGFCTVFMVKWSMSHSRHRVLIHSTNAGWRTTKANNLVCIRFNCELVIISKLLVCRDSTLKTKHKLVCLQYCYIFQILFTALLFAQSYWYYPAHKHIIYCCSLEPLYIVYSIDVITTGKLARINPQIYIVVEYTCASNTSLSFPSIGSTKA